MTTLKLCFNNEIHRTQNVPVNFKDFIKHTESLFRTTLPENWLLQYADNEGDKIMITDQKDYDEFKSLNHSLTTITKIYVVPTETFGVNKFKSEEEINIMEELAAKNEIQPDKLIQVEEEKAEEEKKEELEVVKTPSGDYEVNKKKQVCVDADVLDELMQTMIDKSLPKEVQDDQNIVLPVEKLKESSEIQAIHYGIECNGCGQNPIEGARFKCTTCTQFNYCEKCERGNEHPHNLLKMKHRDIQDVFKPVPFQRVVTVVKNVDDSSKARTQNPFQKFIAFVKGSSNSENNQAVGNSASQDESKKNGKGKDKKGKKDKKDKKNKSYYDVLMTKVEALKKQFPKADVELLCAYVNEAPEDMDVEELIANYRI